MNCIIIEDEPLALDRARGYVAKIPFLALQASFDNGADALVYLQAARPDLIFLDINLGELSGIRLLETCGVKSEVIITTAYDEYALKGFELRVTDYLLKPYTFERFFQAVSRAAENIGRHAAPAPERKAIFVRTEHRLEQVQLSDILYIEGMRDYRRIHTVSRKIMTLQTFSDLEQQIPAHIICRVHKSFMVSLDRIEAIDRDGIRIGHEVIPVSETYRKAFFERVNGMAH